MFNAKLIFIFLLLSVSTSTYAIGWPILSAPDKNFLLQQKLIQTENCPQGQGKIQNGTAINIHQFLCKSFCPIDWNWIVSSNEKCHDLNSNFILQNFQITYVRNKNGNTDHTITIAFYGELNSYLPSFQMLFTTKANENWYCYEMNPNLHLMMCGNDI